MTFQKGQSGNPKGRPKKIIEEVKHSVLIDLFDTAAEQEVIRNMITLASQRIENSSVSVNAATWLWDRKYGKVVDQLKIEGQVEFVKGYVSVNPDEWDEQPSD